MCLRIDETKHLGYNHKPLTAEQDILVWKFLLKNNKSPYQGFRYKPNATYKSIKLNPIDIAIDVGYHSWQSRSIARTKNKMSAFSGERKIVKFFIPKGSQYFFGNNGDIVSSRIRSGDLKSQ